MFRKKTTIFLVVTICFVVIAGVAYLAYDRSYFEVEVLSDTSFDESGYIDYFSDLAKKKNSQYAFEVLRRITLPLGVNEHSVAHRIGYVLFEEKGISGIYDCTEEFRSACAHAIVIQAISKEGPQAIEKIIETCARAPGGTGAYAICFHGIGHGFVALYEYDFKSSIMQCVDMPVVTAVASGHRFMNATEECVGGAVMEMVQGEHDRAEWKRAVSVYLPIDDPFRPCTDTYVPSSLRSACLMSLTQRFFGFASISEDIPLPETYSDAMAVCALASNKDDQVACYGGFGKEFVFYATQFDGGDVNTLSDNALKNIQDWCVYAGNTKGVTQCLSVALDTLFWAGQNDPHTAVRFCSRMPEENRQDCYVGLVENIKYFLEGKSKSACEMLPLEFQKDCSTESAFLFIPPDFGTISI